MAKKATKKKIKNDFSAGGVVWDPSKKKVLVIHVENLKKQQVWTFPKGHPEGKETDQEAALREVREETGWNAEILDSLVDAKYFYQHKGVRYKKVVRWFFMKPVKKVGEFDPAEIIECEWLALKEAEKRIFYDSDKKLVLAVKKMIEP